jgi:glycosyltransferase involved in cell wall biosynthesis
MKVDAVVSMPCFNEEEGIEGFLSEIQTAFHAIGATIGFVVVDDRSSDKSFERLSQWKNSNFSPTLIIQNSVNLGHGPSTLVGLRYAILESASETIVISVDGDGQFKGDNIASLYLQFKSSGTDILEGARINRNEPYFRKLVSFVTRVMVGLRVRSIVKDANTPLRMYKTATLKVILDKMPSALLTPNLFISALSRNRNFSLIVLEIDFFPRRGANISGTMWKSKLVNFPSRRFLKFCWLAGFQWFTFDFLQE